MNTATSPPSIVPFCFNDFPIRTITIADDPWFVAKDVCDVLEINWNGSSTLAFLDSDELMVWKLHTIKGEKDTFVISESGLYTLAIRSNKPQAKPFRKWVTAEVLPTLRRTGSYTIDRDDKRVFINHRRTTASPGGLDVRYALDLTRMIMRPNKTTIAMLERITGIQLSDIPLDGCFDKNNPINTFIVRHCRQADPGKNRMRIKDVYDRFASFFKAEQKTLRGLPGMRELSSELQKSGFESRKTGGASFIYGIQLTEEV